MYKNSHPSHQLAFAPHRGVSFARVAFNANQASASGTYMYVQSFLIPLSAVRLGIWYVKNPDRVVQCSLTSDSPKRNFTTAAIAVALGVVNCYVSHGQDGVTNSASMDATHPRMEIAHSHDRGCLNDGMRKHTTL